MATSGGKMKTKQKKGKRFTDIFRRKRDKEDFTKGWKHEEPIRRIFGQPLNVVWSDGLIPDSIWSLFAIVYKHRRDSEGVFRKCARKDELDLMVDRVDTSDSALSDEECSSKVAAAVIKTLIRQIPNGLLLSLLQDDWLNVSKLDDYSLKINKTKSLIEQLPPVNRKLFAILLVTLRCIADASDLNKMSPSALSICCSPTVFPMAEATSLKPLSHNNSVVTRNTTFCSVLQFFIEQAEHLISRETAEEVLEKFDELMECGECDGSAFGLLRDRKMFLSVDDLTAKRERFARMSRAINRECIEKAWSTTISRDSGLNLSDQNSQECSLDEDHENPPPVPPRKMRSPNPSLSLFSPPVIPPRVSLTRQQALDLPSFASDVHQPRRQWGSKKGPAPQPPNAPPYSRRISRQNQIHLPAPSQRIIHAASESKSSSEVVPELRPRPPDYNRAVFRLSKLRTGRILSSSSSDSDREEDRKPLKSSRPSKMPQDPVRSRKYRQQSWYLQRPRSLNNIHVASIEEDEEECPTSPYKKMSVPVLSKKDSVSPNRRRGSLDDATNIMDPESYSGTRDEHYSGIHPGQPAIRRQKVVSKNARPISMMLPAYNYFEPIQKPSPRYGMVCDRYPVNSDQSRQSERDDVGKGGIIVSLRRANAQLNPQVPSNNRTTYMGDSHLVVHQTSENEVETYV